MKNRVRCFLFPLFAMICLQGGAQVTNGQSVLITSEAQLSSPFTEPNEGQYLSALLDGDTQTYWHSCYSRSDASALHWIEVALREPKRGLLNLYIHRRVQAANDHPTLFQISASKDGQTWVAVDTVDVPYTEKNGVISAPFALKEETAYLRLAPLDCYPNFRKFWHASELQLYYLGDSDNVTTDADALRMNEVQVANVDQFIDPSFNYGSWVELYNTSDVALFLNDVTVRHTDADGITEEYALTSEHGFVSPRTCMTLWFDHHSSKLFLRLFCRYQINRLV